MKLSLNNPRTSVPSVIAAIIATTIVVSAIWIFPCAGAVQSMRSKLEVTERSRRNAEERASAKIAERQRTYLKTLSATLQELERLRARIEKAEERGEVFETRKELPLFAARGEESEAEASPEESVAVEDAPGVPPEVSAKLAVAENYLKARRYYKALEIAKEIDELKTDFPGSEYIRFQVNKEMGFDELAARSAENIIKASPEDTRARPQYLYLIDYYFSSDQKRRAEEVFMKALKLWPEGDMLKREFKMRFGYEPGGAAEAPEMRV